MLRQVTIQHLAIAGSPLCPSIESLVAAKELEPVDHSDPWGNAFEIECSDDDVTIRSAGPDQNMGSSDDIVVPSS